MEYLVIRIQGLLMSFGEGDHWDVRGTNKFPTKSFIVGIIAAGLGLHRNATEEIRQLSKGISCACREDASPAFLRDYHTILDTMKADGKQNKNAVVSPRHYLANGSYTVLIGLKNSELKENIVQALSDPVWPPYLGRKSCVPSIPLYSGNIIKSDSDYEAFKKVHVLTDNNNSVFSCIGESEYGRMSYVKDEILSFDPRVYKDRKVYYYTLSSKDIIKQEV
ncbi:MAG: type I-E CRISPR-associated protein Cas5/CasD [Spirochaetes bacterium]|nr:type I-E CRISPR-associated protein Cas5/CasD [Spirochaetota bacterium]MBN2770110.1 type I-E CRISPR-associated protein Cas5/CasD [Spirochaetota bacterium]